MSKHFDYIIIGAGSAGCVVANRLSKDKNTSVLLIEAGKEDHFFTSMPISFSWLIDNPSANWCYRSEPEKNTNFRNIPVPRGKLLGGSSSINGLVYVRGNENDYNLWSQMGNRGWSPKDVFPIFKRIENYQNGEDNIRGSDGPLKVTEYNENNLFSENLFNACKSLKIPVNKDYNANNQEGIAKTQTTMFKGKRTSARVAYLDPVRNRKNLKIITNTLVQKLLLKNKKCYGVDVIIKKQRESFFASKEVIICAGSINSPQLLELSGIGNPEILKKHNISIEHENVYVGENLQDHIGPRIVYKSIRPDLTFNKKGRGLGLIYQVFKYFAFRKGLLSLPSAPVVGFFKTRNDLEDPDIQVHCIPFRIELKNNKRVLGKEPGFTFTVNQNRPESRGHVHIKSPDPNDYPAITYNFFSTELDKRTIIDGFKFIRKIANTEIMQKVISEEMIPGIDKKSDDEIFSFICERAETIYHPVGTCRMGKKNQSVVDDNLRVHGISNLRIADGSIMPTVISGNTNAACIMIGEKCADLILKQTV